MTASTDVEGLVKRLRGHIVALQRLAVDAQDEKWAFLLDDLKLSATTLSQSTSPEGAIARMNVLCREAIMNACVGRNLYTVNELLERFDNSVKAITTSEGPSKIKLPVSPDTGGGPISTSPEGMVAVPRDVLEPLAKLADAEPIMAGRGENTRPRTPADSDRYDYSYNLTWGMVRAVKKALAPTPPREASR